jgi:twinkle protein
MLVEKTLIIDAKEKFGEKAAGIIAKDLDIQNYDEENLKGSCPFGHSDSTPSLIWDSKANSYHCFSCGKNYGIVDHYMSFYRMTFLDAIKKLFSETETTYRFGEKGVKTDREYKYPKYENIGVRTRVEEYLVGFRNLSVETLDYCDVTEDAHGNVVFNFYDENDVLTLVKYRPSRTTKAKESKSWCQVGADSKNILFNMNRIDPTKPLVLVEGEIDCLSLIEAGYKNCVSIPLGVQNSKYIEENFDWFEQFDKIIVWFDNDNPGLNGRKEACSRLGTWRTYFIDLPKTLEKDGQEQEVKDANSVLHHFGKQKIFDIIDTAQEVPIANVIDLYDVPEFDIETADGIYPSSPELKEYIYKYLLGTVLILTGRNGNGKSVFLNQEFIVEPLNQGKDIFVYSAEMGRPLLRNWIDLALVGRDNVKLKNGTIHQIEPTALKKMRDWYKGRVFVYDDDKDLSADSILDRLETVIRRNGVKVAIFDNLLTIDLPVSPGSDIWQEQKKFMVRLINFAAKYNIFIVLVAHPKKTTEFRRLTSDDVGGVGAITNLAHYVLSIHRYSKTEREGTKGQNGKFKAGLEPKKFDCVIDLFKNRVTGHSNKEIEQYFDYQSYRFYRTPKELWKRYKWDERGNDDLPTTDPNKHESVPDIFADEDV